MRLSIIEIDYHSEVLRNLCLVLNNSEFQVKVFTTERIWGQVSLEGLSPNIQVFTFPKREIKSFFLKNRKEVNESDLVIFNTLASFFNFFRKYNFEKPVLVRVHNANAFFRPGANWQPPKTFDELLYDLRHVPWKTVGHLDWYFRSKLLQQVDGFLFPGQNVIDHVKGQNWIPESKIIGLPLPNTFAHSDDTKPGIDEPIKICVPGSVEKKRRDYEVVVEAIMLAMPRFRKPLHLVLLGKLEGAYGQRIRKKLSELDGEVLNTTTFDEFVPRNQFEEFMASCHGLIAPVRTETRYQIYREVYGRTKISGAENEMIRWGKPAIFPWDYRISEELRALSFQYSNATDLSEILVEWTDSPPKANRDDLKVFNPGFIRKRLRESLEPLIK